VEVKHPRYIDTRSGNPLSPTLESYDPRLCRWNRCCGPLLVSRVLSRNFCPSTSNQMLRSDRCPVRSPRRFPKPAPSTTTLPDSGCGSSTSNTRPNSIAPTPHHQARQSSSFATGSDQHASQSSAPRFLVARIVAKTLAETHSRFESNNLPSHTF